MKGRLLTATRPGDHGETGQTHAPPFFRFGPGLPLALGTAGPEPLLYPGFGPGTPFFLSPSGSTAATVRPSGALGTGVALDSDAFSAGDPSSVMWMTGVDVEETDDLGGVEATWDKVVEA